MKVAIIFTASPWSASGQWANQFNAYAPRLPTSRKPSVSNAAVRSGILLHKCVGNYAEKVH